MSLEGQNFDRVKKELQEYFSKDFTFDLRDDAINADVLYRQNKIDDQEVHDVIRSIYSVPTTVSSLIYRKIKEAIDECDSFDDLYELARLGLTWEFKFEPRKPDVHE